MDLSEIFLGSGAGIVLLLSLVQVSKIQINPWSWLANAVGHAMTRGVVDEVKALQGEMEGRINTRIDGVEKRINLELLSLEERLNYKVDSTSQERVRSDIFRFNEGLRNKFHYTEEHWNHMRDTVNSYLAFCESNPQFLNSKCERAIQNILDGWMNKRWEEGTHED